MCVAAGLDSFFNWFYWTINLGCIPAYTGDELRMALRTHCRDIELCGGTVIAYLCQTYNGGDFGIGGTTHHWLTHHWLTHHWLTHRWHHLPLAHSPLGPLTTGTTNHWLTHHWLTAPFYCQLPRLHDTSSVHAFLHYRFLNGLQKVQEGELASARCAG